MQNQDYTNINSLKYIYKLNLPNNYTEEDWNYDCNINNLYNNTDIDDILQIFKNDIHLDYFIIGLSKWYNYDDKYYINIKKCKYGELNITLINNAGNVYRNFIDETTAFSIMYKIESNTQHKLEIGNEDINHIFNKHANTHKLIDAHLTIISEVITDTNTIKYFLMNCPLIYNCNIINYINDFPLVL
jgi:hypothetical protein